MDNDTYNKTYQSLTNLFFNCKKAQETNVVKKFRIQDPIAHAKEFGTIAICGTRRSGHTTSIARLLNNLNGNWIVINPNLEISIRCCQTVASYLGNHEITKQCKTKITTNNINIDFISLQQLDRFDRLRGMDLNGIIVDCATFIKRKQKRRLYLDALPCMRCKDYVFFIFVG